MSRGSQKGFVLLPVLLAMTLVAISVLLLNYEGANQHRLTQNELESARLDYVVEAGMNHALWKVHQQGCGPYTNLNNVPFGADNYSTTVTPNKAGGTTTTYTVQVSDDAWIKSDTPSQNYGNDAQLSTYFMFFSSTQRTLIKFDIQSAAIPAGAQVISAIAKIFVVDSNDGADVSVHRINADWDEATVNWDNINTKYDTSSIASIPKAAPAGQYVSINITPLVQGWINGGTSNQGIMLKTAGIDDLAQYASKEYGNTAQRPYLEVTVLDGTLSNRADIRTTGTLADGTTRSRDRKDVVLYQAPTNVLTQQPGAADGEDTFILASKVDRNYGAHWQLWVTRWAGDDGRALLQFNLGMVPPGAHIKSAKLELYQDTPSSDGGPVSVHRVTADWTEGSSKGQAGPGANWNQRDTGLNWSNPGGDYDPNAVAVTMIPMGAKDWFSWDITSLVQGWVDGTYANQGLMLFPAAADTDVYFSSSDATDATLHPKLTVEYACECGIVCQAPQGSGKVLLVVGDAASLAASDVHKKSLFESWGYTVSLIDDDSDQASFDAALSNNEVAFVSDTISSWILGSKLTSTTKGVVNQDGRENKDLGISDSYGHVVALQLGIMDNSHYITSLFPNGVMPVFFANMEGLYAAGQLATDLQILGEFSGSPGIAVVEKGGVLADGSSTAAGRRVMLPIGRNAAFNWQYLNNNGQLLVQRAIQWAATAPPSPPPAMKVYWTDDQANKIQRADPDGSNLEDVLTGLDAPTGLAIDTDSGKLYWVNGNSQVRRANLDGSGIETVYTDTGVVFDVKLDTVNGKVYWTNDTTRSIRRANLDGSGVETVYYAGAAQPAYISLDSANGQVYYTDYSGGTISRVDFDGTNQIDLVIGLTNPVGNGLDLANGKIYWSDDDSGGSVHRANLDGSGPEILVSGISAPQDIVVDPQNGKFYWAAALDSKVQRADLDGANSEDVATGLIRPGGVVVVEASLVPPVGGGGSGGSGCNGTFRDEFNIISYANNDGTLNWSGDWIEVNESDGAGSGDERVRDDNGPYQLWVRDNDGGGEGVEREADLTGAGSATLSFLYRRSGLDDSNDYVKLEISANGAAGPWTELARFQGNATDTGYQNFSQDISAYISANTRIRFLTSPDMGNLDTVMFDDITIQCSP